MYGIEADDEGYWIVSEDPSWQPYGPFDNLLHAEQELLTLLGETDEPDR